MNSMIEFLVIVITPIAVICFIFGMFTGKIRHKKDNISEFQRRSQDYGKGIDATINALIQRKCVYCSLNLDKDYNIPLCKIHRIMTLDSISEEVLRRKK